MVKNYDYDDYDDEIENDIEKEENILIIDENSKEKNPFFLTGDKLNADFPDNIPEKSDKNGLIIFLKSNLGNFKGC